MVHDDLLTFIPSTLITLNQLLKSYVPKDLLNFVAADPRMSNSYANLFSVTYTTLVNMNAK
jgi:hypothetical protein